MALIDQLEAGGGKDGTGAAIAAAAKRIGCEEDVLWAILEVESGGDPYDAQGRLIILPEKHIFYRYLPSALKSKALRAGLAAKSWSRSNYGGLGGKGSDARWKRLRDMVALDEDAGFKSASYGAPQIMGFNHAICGYPSVLNFVAAMAVSEDNQDAAFIRFLEGVGLAQDLREKDFRAIARRYNGSGQVSTYAGMMANAYARIRREGGKSKDTGPDRRAGMLRLGSEGQAVRDLQQRLVELGYHVVVDGDFGPATRRAVVAFQADHGLVTDGVVGPASKEAMASSALALKEQPGNSREALTVKDLRERGSQTVKEADRLTTVGTAAAGLGTAGAVLDQLSSVSGLVGQFRQSIDPLVAFVAENKWLALGLIGAAVIVLAIRIKRRRLDDARNWRHVG